jgi:raffinose/stachyose/melibiose transport system substrate-binding protein
MKKFLYTVCALLLTAVMIAGCAGQQATPAAAEPTTAAAEPTEAVAAEPTEAPATEAAAATEAPTAAAPSGEKVTLTYMASQGWIKDAELELAKQFEKETGIHVDYQIVPADQYFNVLKTKLNSGEAPDIFGGQSGKTDLKVQYDVEKNAVDLTGEEWVSRMDPLAKDQVSLDGKVYGAEIWDIVASNYYVMMYNKDIFTKLGLSVPTTYDEFKADCAKIKEAGITPMFEPISDGWHHVLWFPMIGPRFEEMEPGLADKLNANQATFADDANMLKAMTQLNELYQLGYWGDNTLSDATADTNKIMSGGEYAMALVPLAQPASIIAEYPDVKASSFGFFPIPLLDNQLAPGHPAGPSKFIYSGSKHIDEAKQYFAFLTKQESLQYLLDNTPDFVGLDFSGVEGKWTAEQKEFLDKYPAKTIVYQDAVNYVNAQWMDMGKDMVSMFTGSIKPVDVLKNIDQRRAEMAKTANDPAWAK